MIPLGRQWALSGRLSAAEIREPNERKRGDASNH
jgi:hypothetical protein